MMAMNTDSMKTNAQIKAITNDELMPEMTELGIETHSSCHLY